MIEFIRNNSVVIAYALLIIILLIILFYIIKLIIKINKIIRLKHNRKLLQKHLVSKTYYDKILDYLDVLFSTDELHNVRQCSKQIVSNFSSYKKFDYLIKYFGFTVNDLTYETLNSLKIYIEDIYKELDKYDTDVVNTFEEEFLPSFTVCYESAGKRVNEEFTLILDIDNLNYLIECIENRFNKYPKYLRERNKITEQIRDSILQRDNFTCQRCGNSQYKEPNLLLEIDHIIPISKGGKTEPNNLQTLCWKCNRTKADSFEKD